MSITDTGLSQIALITGGGGTVPSHIAIGTGSATLDGTETSLNTETERNLLSSIDTAIGSEITYISDFSASEISGTALTEFGLFNSSSGASMFQNEVIGSEQFVGDRELQIQMTLRYRRA